MKQDEDISRPAVFWSSDIFWWRQQPPDPPTVEIVCVCVWRFFSAALCYRYQKETLVNTSHSYYYRFSTLPSLSRKPFLTSFPSLTPLFFFAFVVWGFFFLLVACLFLILCLCTVALLFARSINTIARREEEIPPLHPAVPFWRSNALPPPPLISLPPRLASPFSRSISHSEGDKIQKNKKNKNK